VAIERTGGLIGIETSGPREKLMEGNTRIGNERRHVARILGKPRIAPIRGEVRGDERTKRLRRHDTTLRQEVAQKRIKVENVRNLKCEGFERELWEQRLGESDGRENRINRIEMWSDLLRDLLMNYRSAIFRRQRGFEGFS
jgi:hypothetical protein